MADQAKLLGIEAWGNRRWGECHPSVDRMHRPEELDAIQGQIDFVVVAAPLTKLTRGTIGAEQIARMKSGADFVSQRTFSQVAPTARWRKSGGGCK
jgi:phosphoglycerate dehydrogenase-like enzyme